MDNQAIYQQLSLLNEQLQAQAKQQALNSEKEKASVISFMVEGVHPYDLGVLLDKQGIAVRTGHHCCQPLMNHFNIEGTCRISFAVYNTKAEIDAFMKALNRALMMVG